MSIELNRQTTDCQLPSAFRLVAAQRAAILAARDAGGLDNAVAAQRGGEQLLSTSGRTAALTLVRDCCTARLDAMAASAPAVADAAGAGVPRLGQLVAEVRARERRVLERAKFLLTQERAALRS